MKCGYKDYFIRNAECDIHYIPEIFAYYFESEVREIVKNIHESGRDMNVFLLKKDDIKIIFSNELSDNSITIQFEGEYKPKDIFKVLDVVIQNVFLDESLEEYEKMLYIDGIVYEKIIHDISASKGANYKYKCIEDNLLGNITENESFKMQSIIWHDNGIDISMINYVPARAMLHTYIHSACYISGQKIGTTEDGYNVDLIEYCKLLQQRAYMSIEKNYKADYIAQLYMKWYWKENERYEFI